MVLAKRKVKSEKGMDKVGAQPTPRRAYYQCRLRAGKSRGEWGTKGRRRKKNNKRGVKEM